MLEEMKHPPMVDETPKVEQSTEIVRAKPAPLPTDPIEIELRDERAKKRPLKEHVKVHVKVLLAEDQRFRDLVDACYPEDAVEGSLDADDFVAAMHVREFAQKQGDTHVAEQPISKMRTALKRALGDMRFARFQRREDAEANSQS